MATQCTLSLNAKAVTMLHDDTGLVEAGPIFRQAIQAAACTLVNIGTTDEADAQDGTLLDNVPVSLNDKVSILVDSFSPDNSFCIYSKAFLIRSVSSHVADGVNSAPSTPLQISELSQLQLIATILYNWGLASHWKAICTSASRYVHMAMRLYNKALEAMMTCKEDTSNDSLDLLYLALCNNLGHCCSYFSDEVKSRMFQECLKSFLATFHCPEKFHCEYSFFYEKTFVTMAKTFAPAA
jgi:hypothetical protein